jgi:hypothetical protein
MKKCNICGKHVAQDAESCPECGNPFGSSHPDPQNTDYQQEPVNPDQPKLETAPVAPATSEGNPAPVVNATPYLIWSILNVVFCCMPLGIAGIIYANKAGKAATPEEGQKHLGTARIICIIATVAGFILSLIYIAIKMQ